MQKLIDHIRKGPTKYAVILFVILAIFVMVPLFSAIKTEAMINVVAFKASVVGAFAGDGTADGGGVGDGGGCCAPSDPAPDSDDPAPGDGNPLPPPPPPPPEPIPAVPNPSYVCSADGSSVTFNFGVSGATVYNLRLDDNYVLPELRVVDGYTSTSWTTNVNPGQSYHFWVHAGNQSGFSDAGAIDPFKCDAPVVKPPVPHVSYVCAADGRSVTFSFGVSGAENYFIRFDTDMSQPHIDLIDGYTSTTWTKSDITPGQSYYFWAHAGNGGNNWNTDISDYDVVNFSCQAPVTPQPTCTLSANPSTLPFNGGNTNLSWSSTNAQSASINQGVGNVATNGSKSVFTNTSKTYTLTVTGAGGTATCSAPVTVAQATVPACDLSLNKTSITAGESVTATWSSQNGVQASLNGSAVALQGSQSFTPNQNTTYTFIVEGQNQSVTCQKSITVNQPQQPSCTIYANPNNFPYGGGNTTLTWSSQNANSASINQGVGSVNTNGSKSVSVNASKTFTLTVSGPGGTATCQAPVTVNAPLVPACDLSLNKTSIHPGESVTATWTSQNGVSAKLNGNSVSLQGNQSFTPNQSTNYVFVVTGQNSQQVTCEKYVTVVPHAAPTCTITANPNNFPYGGGNTNLSWTTTNAQSASINQGVGAVNTSGSQSVQVGSSKTFTLTATGPGGTVTCSAPVTVGIQDYPTCSIYANPNNLPYPGGNTNLTWSTDNADSVTIDQGVGSVVADGSQNVNVTQTKTFTLTATNSRGSIQCHAPVTVGQPSQPTCSLIAYPDDINKGENARIDWSSTNVTGVVIKATVNGNETTIQNTNANQGSVIVMPQVSTTYKGTFTGPGGTVTCEDIVTVKIPQLSCAITASPNSHAFGGGNSTLNWSSTGATSATIDQGVGSVSLSGSQDVFVNNSKTFKLTVSNGYETKTCTAPVTVAAPQAPTCTLAASPNNFPYGGGNTNLSWTTSNATSVTIDQGVGSVSTNGSQGVQVGSSKTFKLTATGPGGTVECTAPVTVGIQDYPTCSIYANPTNFPYGGGNTNLTWTTNNADTVSIDQGVGAVNKNGSQSVGVSQTKTFTLTATNSRGSVQCYVPVTVGAPQQPTCGLTVSPGEINKGENARVDWTSTNVTGVVIKAVVNGNESTIQNTSAGQGSYIVSPQYNTTYKGTFTGPGGTVTCEDTIVVKKPQLTCVISASPSNFPYGGGNTTLTWSSTGGTAASINQGVGTVALNGSQSVQVGQTKTFTLTVTGDTNTSYGSYGTTHSTDTVTCSTTVTVGNPSQPACTLTASPNNFPYGGGNTTLTWTTQHASSVNIDQGVGGVAVNGSRSVAVNASKTYKLTATGPGGTVECTAPVTVASPQAPTCTLNASPNNFPYGGGNTNLSWTTTNANNVTIDQGVGSVSTNGSQSIQVGSSKTFKLTATGPGGSVECTAPVTVAAPQAPTCTLNANPDELPAGGGNSTLTWTTTNANTVSIDQGVGAVSTNGTQSVAVNASKTYKLTATGPGGTVTCEDKVVVKKPELSCVISASPSNFPYGGGNTTLTWSSTGGTSASINEGVGDVSLNGSQSVAINGTKTFTLTVKNESYDNDFFGYHDDDDDHYVKQVSCSTTVIVGPPSVPTCTLNANPNSLPYGGGNTTLNWTTSNATSITIDQGVGSVPANGSQGVAVTEGKTFKLTATGPGGTVECTAPVTVAQPQQPTCTLNANPNNFPYGGGNTNLSWSTTNANNVSIDQGVGSVSTNGSQSVQVGSSKTFKLTATGPGGSVECTAPVTVGLQDYPSCTLVANPNNFPHGGGTTSLLWTTDHADTVTIDQGVGAVVVDGTKSVNVTQTKTFTLTATNSRGSVTCQAPVTVGAPEQPTCSINVSPDSIEKGDSANVSWNSTNVTSVVIKKIVGNVETDFVDTNAGSGSNVVTPAENATYKGTFTGPGGTVTCEDTITVREKPKLSCDSFSVTPGTIDKNDNVTLTWNTSNADSVSINNGVGAVALDGTHTRQVSSDTNFTLTAKRGSEEVTCETSVSVRSSGGGGGGSKPPRCEEFKVSDKTIRPGETVELSWETTRGTKLVINHDVLSTTDSDTVKDGSIRVKPKDDTKYTLTVSKGSRKDTCTVEVKVSGLTVISTREPLTSIKFTEIPYTGFDAGPFLTGLFYVLLALWGVAIAYLFLFERRTILSSLPGFNLRTEGPGVIIPQQDMVMSTTTEDTHDVHEDILPHYEHIDRSAPINLPTAAASHAHMSEVLTTVEEAPAWRTVSDADQETEMINALESVAHAHNVLLSSDALRLVIDHGETLEGSREALLSMIERAKAAYPREDGWIVLNRARVLELFEGVNVTDPLRQPADGGEVSVAAPVVEAHGATTLAEAIVTGNTTRAFELLGSEPLHAIADAAEALDSVVRARAGKGTAPDMLMHAAAPISDDRLKGAIIALLAAIDGTYSDQNAAVRLSVIKALKTIA